MTPYLIAIEGLSDLGDLRELDAKTSRSLKIAVNAAVDKARTRLSSDIRSHLNFTQPYLAQRMKVVKRATNSDFEGVIAGRDRPTSLARFLTNSPKRGRAAIVQVAAGASKPMTRAFVINLANGNRGLAMRLKPGEAWKNKKFVRRFEGDLYLLYGPSVNQAMRMVAEDRVDDVAGYLENEFLRLMELDL